MPFPHFTRQCSPIRLQVHVKPKRCTWAVLWLQRYRDKETGGVKCLQWKLRLMPVKCVIAILLLTSSMMIHPHFYHSSLSVLSSWHSQHSQRALASQPLSAKSGVNTKGSESPSDWTNILLARRTTMNGTRIIKVDDLLKSKRDLFSQICHRDI